MQEAGTNGSICLLHIHRQNNLSWAGGAGRSHTKGKATRICSQPLIVVLYKKMKPKKREEVKDERENSIWSVEVQDKSTWGSWRNCAVNESEMICIYLNELCWNSLVTYKSFAFYAFLVFLCMDWQWCRILKLNEFIRIFPLLI